MIGARGFAFVVSHINVDEEKPIQLIPDYEFRKASDKEVKIIQEWIQREIQEGATYFVRRVYEQHFDADSFEKGLTGEHTPLPREDWKYWVVGYSNCLGNELEDLNLTFSLLPKELITGPKCGWTCQNPGDAEQFYRFPFPSYLSDSLPRHDFLTSRPALITSDDLDQVPGLYQLVRKRFDEYPFVRHALDNFHDLRRLPHNSNLIIVGYLSVIESLVTHQPRLNENLDSIGHQLKNKLALVSKRFEHKVKHQDYFAEIDFPKLWASIYSYRSAVAHGNNIDFNDKKYKALKDHATVRSYVREVVKQLLIFAMRDPEFADDLRNC